jgi:NADPH-dependent 2,4-dienoyl-CoA reductase/sulfur reductase-like enzyme
VNVNHSHRILVVGAGRAGVSAAEGLRRGGYAGEVMILHDEPIMPYDRPGCAKGLLTGHSRPRDLKMSIAADLEVDWRLGRRAVHLDTATRSVITDTDEAYEYDNLVIASGARAVPPPGLPLGEPGIHLLYRLEDAWELRGSLHRASRVAVIGAGLTGCEVASAVRAMSRQCVLVDSKIPLTRPMGEHAARLIEPEMRRAGVDLRIGRRMAEIYRGRRDWVLVLDDGEEINVDVIVATTGERPDVDWLARVPEFDTSDGVLCDENLRVVGGEGVVAAGTVARWPNLQYSSTPARVGQWIAALEHGQAAARTLLAGSTTPEPVIHQPRFWSDQFGLRLQVCGSLPEEADVSLTEMRPGRRDVARAGVLLSYQHENRIVGLVGVNASHAFTSMARAMIATRGAMAAPAEMAGNSRGRRYLAAVG